MRKIRLQILTLIVVIVLVGCRESVPLSPVSPLQSPLQAVSPLDTAVPTKVPTPSSLLGKDFDPAQAVLTADDMSDLFKATYGLKQPYQRDGMRGIQVIYPTKTIKHTSAFVEGFATQIEIYDEFVDAVEAYRTTLADQDGSSFKVDTEGDKSSAFRIPADMPGIHVFKVIIRKDNALAIITVKSPEALETATIERISDIVVGRLAP